MRALIYDADGNLAAILRSRRDPEWFGVGGVELQQRVGKRFIYNPWTGELSLTPRFDSREWTVSTAYAIAYPDFKVVIEGDTPPPIPNRTDRVY